MKELKEIVLFLRDLFIASVILLVVMTVAILIVMILGEIGG